MYPLTALNKLQRYDKQHVYKWSVLSCIDADFDEQFGTGRVLTYGRQNMDGSHIVPNSPGLFVIRSRSESFRTMFEWHGSNRKKHEVSAMHIWFEFCFESISELFETVLNYLQLVAMVLKVKYLSSDALQPFSHILCLILCVV